MFNVCILTCMHVCVYDNMSVIWMFAIYFSHIHVDKANNFDQNDQNNQYVKFLEINSSLL